MFIINRSYKKFIKKDPTPVYNKIKPFLKHGAIVLSNQTNIISFLFSPTIIKHCGFIYIKNNNEYVVSMTESGFLETPILEYITMKDEIFIFYFRDLDIMKQSMNSIYDYQDYTYGFSKDTMYCFKLLIYLYRDLINIDEEINFFKVGGYEFINANSIIESKSFLPICFLIRDIFIDFTKK